MSNSASIHAEALIIDGHADTPQRFLDESWDFTSPSLAGGMLSLATARAGNLAAGFLAIWVEPTEHAGAFAHRALTLIDAVRQQIARHPESLQLCLNPVEILSARAAGRFGILLGVEGGHAIENSLALLRIYYALGIRYMTLTWSNSNDWAESSGPINPTRHAGLTDFGREVIREMNSLGMMIDVSHVSDETLADVLSTSTVPVIASHSSARALTDVPRNLTDDQMRAIAAAGGIVMANFYPGFLSMEWHDAWEASRPARSLAQEAAAAPYRATGQPVPHSVSNAIDQDFAARIPRPPLSDLISHIDHIIRTAGPNHAGVGSDFDGIPTLPQGLESAADLPRITEALFALGHHSETLKKVLGGNLLRVFNEVQSAAGQI